MKKITLVMLFCSAFIFTKAQTTISIKDISKHIGETVTLTDSVYTTRALPNLTLINLGADFPKQLLTVVIYKADMDKFKSPEKVYLNKKVAITGKLELYKEQPQIVLIDPKQIVLQNPY